MADRVLEELQRARQKLLDLSARNRLLNYRPTRRTSVRIVDEMPDQVWRLLVTDEKKLSFLAREEHERFGREEVQQERGGLPFADEAPGEPEDTLFALPDLPATPGEGELPGRYTDLFLQTTLDGENLQTNLLRIEQAARSALAEQGVNYLFLAMGFVAWCPGRNSQESFRAPVVLVPVKLERTSAQRPFRLSMPDEELAINPCLAAKLREFRLELPASPEDWTDFAVEDYLRQVENTIAQMPGWQVTRDIYLGLFSFAKYLMYLDLDPVRWPVGTDETGKKTTDLETNALIQALLDPEHHHLADLTDLPDVRELIDQSDPEEAFVVQDADSSQLQAILAAKRGKSLVIKGPPGTGKSQTITNVIAECLAAGKKVLFVSEKMAALEVVKRRLEKVGLGDFCLELHSSKANRRAMLEELSRAWQPTRRVLNADGAAALIRLRQRLNAYVQALHAPLSPSVLTPYAAMGRVAMLSDVPDIFAEMPGHPNWDQQEFAVRREQLEQLGRQASVVHPVSAHPWRAARIASATGQLSRTVAELIDGLLATLDEMVQAAEATAGAVGSPTPQSVGAAITALAAAKCILESPEPARRLLEEPVWDEPTEELGGLLAKVKAYVDGLKWLRDRYSLERVSAVDWQAMRGRCMQYWASPARWFRWGYWSDKKALKRAREKQHRPKFEEQVGDLKRLAEMQRLRQEIDGAEVVGRRHFDDAWHGARSDWSRIIRLHNWLRQFRTAVKRGEIGPAGISQAATGADRSGLHSLCDRLEGHLATWREKWASLVEAVALNEPAFAPQGVDETSVGQFRDALQAMGEGIERLFDWAQYQEALQACAKGPMAGFVAEASKQDVEPSLLALAGEKQYMRLLAEDAIAERQELRRFNGANHEADRRAFAQADLKWVRQTGRRLQARLVAKQPMLNSDAARSSQVGILLGEINRKRGGRPIRRILHDAGEAVQGIRPCFMMSPLSVAHFLDPAGLRFDVVIFDEASQVEPPDALGAIARASQLLLVGDQKQLPPTSFFRTMSGEAPAETEGAATITDMESILDLGVSALPGLPLRWHYRSRHASLIAFSNREFYNNELVVFPSCHTDTSELGLSMQHEASDLYDRGRSQKNTAQARRVAEWVFDHARRHPDRTLGVGAFSVAQQQAVLDEIERMRREDDSLEEYFDQDQAEPFFVKNLETIQGDERDVILLSIGYGRGQPGERLSMNFGPLNHEGGWRRLNVLVTRARERCVVFSSIRAKDFDLQASPARGVHALKNYLHYALAGVMPDTQVGDGEFGSDFERAVYDALTGRGMVLHRQVGCAGYAIDLAVVDPSLPGKYILGIECDGAAYHSSACARDRDRLRQQVLEGLGWKIHRIWSTDWFRKPGEELQRALDAIRRGRSGHWVLPLAVEEPDRNGGEGDEEDRERIELVPDTSESLADPYACYEGTQAGTPEEFYLDQIDVIAKVVNDVVCVEGPIREELAIHRVAKAWGLSRAGSRIEQRARRALGLCLKRKQVMTKDGFLWPKGMSDPPVRRREDPDLRDIEMICLEEIGRAAWLVLKSQLGMNRNDLVVQTARLLGFGNVGSRVQDRVQEAIGAELAAGRIAGEAGLLRAV